jgi:hypothetical protein
MDHKQTISRHRLSALARRVSSKGQNERVDVDVMDWVRHVVWKCVVQAPCPPYTYSTLATFPSLQDFYGSPAESTPSPEFLITNFGYWKSKCRKNHHFEASL